MNLSGLMYKIKMTRAKAWLTLRDSWKEVAWYWAYLAMVVWERALSQRHIFFVPVGSQFSSAGCESWVQTSTRCSGLASTNVFVENRPRSAEKQKKYWISCNRHDTGKYTYDENKNYTQFECSSQTSDDSDGVGGVCAELVQWGEESIPLVLQLVHRQETESWRTYRTTTTQYCEIFIQVLTYMLGVGGLSLSLGRAGEGGGGSRGGGHLSRRMLLLESPFFPRFLPIHNTVNGFSQSRAEDKSPRV